MKQLSQTSKILAPVKRLIELSQIVTKNRLKKIDMLSPSHIKGINKYLEVTDSLAKNDVTSIKEMADIIGEDENSNNFHVFRSRLFEKLLNSLLFLDIDERKFHSYGISISECYRNAYCVRILLLLNAKESAAFIAKKTLKKAIKFQFADIILFCARHLRTHYSFIGDEKNFRYYNTLVKQYYEILAAEDAAAECLEEINSISVNSNTSQKEIVLVACKSLSNIQLLFEKYPTYQISLNFYRIKGLTEFLNRNYDASIRTWEKFDELIEHFKDFEYYARKGESDLYKMDCYLNMRDFKNGSKCALSCDSLFKLYSTNWYIFKEYYLLLAFHTSNYQQAADTINIIVESNHFKQLTSNRQEKWRIFEAYLYILWKSGRVKGVDINNRSANFRLGKFINETPILSKDKKGFNASILIIQVLFSLIEKKYSEVSDKIDALERYNYRYFNEEKDSRARTFLTMIIIAEKAGFEFDKTQQKTEKLYSKLKEMQFAYIAGLEGLEIVPFVDLWEIVLGTFS